MINPQKAFPVLRGLPAAEQRNIVEQARYHTFTQKGKNALWVRILLLSLVGGFLVGLVFAIAASFVVGSFSILIIGPSAALASVVTTLASSAQYKRLLAPKVDELVGQRQ